MPPIIFRKFHENQQPGPGELWIRPARSADRDSRATALLVLEHGLNALERGSGQLNCIIVDAAGTQPTFDEMLAAWFARRLLDGQQLPECLRSIAEYARLIRQGLTPTSLPPEETIEGIYQAVRNLPGDDLTQPLTARAFLDRWERLADRLLRATKAGRDVFQRSLFASGSAFAEEKAYLRNDENIYCQDVARGERWKVRLPGGPPEASALLLREPKSLLFAFWSRRDRRTPTGEPYLFLAVDWGKAEWVFSTNPVGHISLAGLAERLQEAERSCSGETESNLWYDGRNHRYTLVAAPHGGSKLKDHQVLRIVTRWTARQRPTIRRAYIAAILCIALIACLGGLFGPTNPLRGIDLVDEDTYESAARQGRDYAVLFATNTYNFWPPLGNPKRDSEEIAKIIKNYGFDTKVVEGKKRQEILEEIQSCYRKYGDDDQLLFFFAGHGDFDKDSRRGFLVTVESELPDKDKTRSKCISHDELRSLIDHIPCKHILVIFDICYGGTFDEEVALSYNAQPRGKLRGIPPVKEHDSKFIRRTMKHKTRKYFTSSGTDLVPDGPYQGHSPFAAKLIEMLKTGSEDGVLSFTTIVPRMKKHLAKRDLPEPHYGDFGYCHPDGDFLFIVKRK